ncbi:hypothetical protein ASPTUDRAFT_593126 [Aspergillus tubingensis CBS 134.48]|uniref:AB hydrolase-1 domain-containing protein n=1 Tax=Aspergillus tubingensis (strain CBS 134.48) TaxID=767770 RepID=A0A1L9N8T2_ASPTC|nr:hypothetical protein ASPTUDRAFT_593126 [Aspergillus tubingensis CBS 134.48]
MSTNPLYTGTHISIGPHKLYLHLHGPPRTTQPLTIFLAGAGDVSSSYTAVIRLLSPFAPCLVYDRTGLGRSDAPDQDTSYKPSATLAASELHTLLTNADLPPPYVLVGHSYGAIIAREYLHLCSGDISGMVLVEGSTEQQYTLFEDNPNLDSDIAAIQGEINFATVTGLRENAKLSREEWRERARDIARGMGMWEAERENLVGVCRELEGKRQLQVQGGGLGERPLSVVVGRGWEDYQRVYERGVEMGNGSDEQREAVRRFLGRCEEVVGEWQREQLRLSRRARLVEVDCGHQVHLVRPDVVVEEVKWVLEMIERSSSML